MAIDRNSVIKEAQKFAAKGQFDKAIAEWKKVASESPNDANVFNTIGDLCLKKNSKPEAVEAYQKAADILARDGFSSKAIALYKKVLNIDPKKIETHLALADLNAEKGLTGNALESYKIVADHYTSAKETRKALDIFRKMADLNASNAAFRLKLAEMYAKEGMKPEAVAAYLQAADVHVSKSAFKDARQIFEKALAISPNNKDVYHKAGFVYFKEGKFMEACKALKPVFESDPGNAELADLYLDALSKSGRAAEAEEAYRKLVEANPDRVELREKLYRIYLDQREYVKAFSEVSSLANIRIESNELGGAEDLLKGYIAEAPGNVDGMRALSALYKTTGKENEAATLLVQAAKILIEDGDIDGAQDELAKATELAPDHYEARRLMNSLQPESPAQMHELEAENYLSEAPILEAPAPELEAIPFPPTPEPETVSALYAPPSVSAIPEEDPAVAAAITEIDVLMKYGLATKALEQLEGMAKKFPESIQVRIKLRDIYGDIGNIGKAVSHMHALADIYMQHGMQAEADDVLETARGMEPNNAGIEMGTAENDFVPEAPVPDESLLSPVNEDDLSGLDLTQQAPADELSVPGPLDPAIEELAPPPDSNEFLFDQPFTPPDFPPMEHISEQEFMPETGATCEHPAETPEAASASSEPVAGETDPSEIWAEAEFYYQQGLFDEARKHYEKIINLAPDYGPARKRLAEILKDQEEVQEFSKLADAVTELEGLDGAGYAEPTSSSSEGMSVSASDQEAVRALMQEISQLKLKQAPQQPGRAAAPQTKAASAIPPEKPASAGQNENYFDLGVELNERGENHSFSVKQKAGNEADDFFDLAAELRDELGSASFPSAPSVSAEGQSLDDIFEEFKKGVEQQAIREDADTHYNLGVAYKEMGLLDDAISEFVMTQEDEPKYFQSRYMLGLCYMEKGDFQNAISEMQLAQAIAERHGRSFSDSISISYDLGLAFQCSGNVGNALKEFQKVCKLDPSYRDAADKVKELLRGGDISLARLKTDIANEISSKFLQEGERIELEEKTKKNDRIRR